jgi:hypothetical protein
MSTTTTLVLGIGCAVVCLALGWFTLSRAAWRWRFKRAGLDYDMTAEGIRNLTDEQALAYYDLLDRGRGFVFPTVLSGFAAAVLITMVYPDFPWVLTAGLWGYILWALNEVRLGRRTFHWRR